jgi:hypothetical protein
VDGFDREGDRTVTAVLQTAGVLAKLGAAGFGAIVGWNLYYINRYRRDEVHLSDLVTLIGAIGGAAVTALFPAKTVLFGAYGIGLAIGFFGYFAMLLIFVKKSPAFGVEWFLDQRRIAPEEGSTTAGPKAMEAKRGME